MDASAVSGELAAQWAELPKRASEPNPFAEPWFILPSLGAFSETETGVTLLRFDAGDTLVAIMPLQSSAHYYGHPLPHLTGWLHDNAFYGAPLVRSGYERAFWQALLDHVDAAPGPAMFLHIPMLDETGPLNEALAAVLEDTGRASAIVLRQERAFLCSSLPPADYLAKALSTKHAKELRRQRRRLAELGELAFERLSGSDRLAQWIEDFLALEAAGWKGSAGSALALDPAKRRFFTDVMFGAGAAGTLERLALTLDGKPIAMLANFVTPPGCFSFKTAFDERYAAYSPGMQLQIENLGLLERADIHWADSCAAQGHPMIDRLWTERRPLLSRNIAIGGPLRRTAARALMAWETRKRSKP